jgi:hypothetical protein
MSSEELAEGHRYVQSEFYSFSSILRHIPSLLSVSPLNLRRALVFLLLNFAGMHVAKYLGPSLDWAEGGEKWDSLQIRPDQAVETTAAFSRNEARLQFQALQDGGHRNDMP